jgi:hypothetical protein
MASLVCLVSRHHRESREITLCVAAIYRTKMGYQQIQRRNEMALSTTDALTFTIERTHSPKTNEAEGAVGAVAPRDSLPRQNVMAVTSSNLRL